MKFVNAIITGYVGLLTATVLAIRWELNERVGGAAVAAIAYACGSGTGIPPCVITAVAGLLISIMGSIRADSSGQTGVNLPPDRRDPNAFRLFHDAGNGTVFDGLRSHLLTPGGAAHSLWDNRGNVYTASKHANGIDTQLTVHLPAGGAGLGKRDGTASSISASWRYSGSVYDDYTEDTATKDANTIMSDYDKGKGSFVCSTFQAGSDDEKVEISVTPQGDGLTTEIQPACGA